MSVESQLKKAEDEFYKLSVYKSASGKPAHIFKKTKDSLLYQMNSEQLEHMSKYIKRIMSSVNEGKLKQIKYVEDPEIFPNINGKALEKKVIDLLNAKYVEKDQYIANNIFPPKIERVKEEEAIGSAEAMGSAGGPYVPTKRETTTKYVKKFETVKTEEELEAHMTEMKKIFNDRGDLEIDELHKKALMRINPNSPKLNPLVDQLLQPHVDKQTIKVDNTKKEAVNPEMVLDAEQKSEIKRDAPKSAFMPELKQTDDIFMSAEVGNKHIVSKPQMLLEPTIPDDELNMGKNTMSAVPENKDIVYQPLEPTHEPVPEPTKIEGQIVNMGFPTINPSMQSSKKPTFQQFAEAGGLDEEQAKLESKPTSMPIVRQIGERLKAKQGQPQAQQRPPIFTRQPQGPTITSNVLAQPEMVTPGVGVNAQQLAAIMKATQDHINAAEVEARAGREYDKTIGERSRTGLSANDAVPKADILIKEAKDKKKSLDSFANLSWVETSFGDSKLGRKSSLSKMQDKEDRLRYGYAFFNAPKQVKRRCDIYDDNYEYIKNNFDNRYVPVYGSRYETARHPIYERQNNAHGLRPVGARPYKIDDMGDWTYNYRGVTGTQNLGLAPMYNPTKLKDFQNDTTYYPDTYMRVGGGSALEDNFDLMFR